MKKIKIILLFIVTVFIFFVILSYFVKTPETQRLTFKQSVTTAEGYMNAPVCIVGQGCHKNNGSISIETSFPVYETRDDIPDYLFFPIDFQGQKSWPDTIGVHLLPDEIYTTANYWNTINELKGVNGKNKLYRLSDKEWYGVPQDTSDQTQVEAFCHEFSKPIGCLRSTMTLSEFEDILKTHRKTLEFQKNLPLYRMKVLMNKIF